MHRRATTDFQRRSLRARLGRLGWFVALWLAGVLALGAVAWLIRRALGIG
jgi:hypothetical protein